MGKYIIIESNSLKGFSGLVAEVNEKLEEGYICLGGMTSYIQDNDIFSSNGNLREIKPKNIFCQTMILKEKEEIETFGIPK